ncbi:TPA: YadA C-terminal domain-containing protein [Salmonella enterica subsp. enterica serovar Aberdeen]
MFNKSKSIIALVVASSVYVPVMAHADQASEAFLNNFSGNSYSMNELQTQWNSLNATQQQGIADVKPGIAAWFGGVNDTAQADMTAKNNAAANAVHVPSVQMTALTPAGKVPTPIKQLAPIATPKVEAVPTPAPVTIENTDPNAVSVAGSSKTVSNVLSTETIQLPKQNTVVAPRLLHPTASATQANVTDAQRDHAQMQAAIAHANSLVSGSNGVNGSTGADGVTTIITKADNSAVEHETAARKAEDTAQRKAIVATSQGVFENRTQIDANTGEILSHSRAIASNRAAIDNNSARIDGLNRNFANLKEQVNENRKQANAGISGAMAQANIPQVTENQRFAVGAGVGGYDGENALAVGVSFHATQNVVVKATVSDDTANNVGYGAGVAFGF